MAGADKPAGLADADDVAFAPDGGPGFASGWSSHEKNEIAHVTLSASTSVTIVARAMPAFSENFRPAFLKPTRRSSGVASREPNLVARPPARSETCSLKAAANSRHLSNLSAGSFARPLKKTSSRS